MFGVWHICKLWRKKLLCIGRVMVSKMRKYQRWRHGAHLGRRHRCLQRRWLTSCVKLTSMLDKIQTTCLLFFLFKTLSLFHFVLCPTTWARTNTRQWPPIAGQSYSFADGGTSTVVHDINLLESSRCDSFDERFYWMQDTILLTIVICWLSIFFCVIHLRFVFFLPPIFSPTKRSCSNQHQSILNNNRWTAKACARK